jgi:hypothetical protein
VAVVISPRALPISSSSATSKANRLFQYRLHAAVERTGGRRRSRAMATTFLHADKALPPDEQVDAPPPECPSCGKPMWLVRFTRRASDGGVSDVRSYECHTCGALKDVRARPAAT